MKIAAGQFKAKCLKLMDDICKNQEEVIITKRGKPVVKLIPIEEKHPGPFFGYLKGTVSINSNIVQPIEEKWNVDE